MDDLRDGIFKGFKDRLNNQAGSSDITIDPEKVYAIIEELHRISSQVLENGRMEVRRAMIELNNVDGLNEYVTTVDINGYNSSFDSINRKISKLEKQTKKNLDLFLEYGDDIKRNPIGFVANTMKKGAEKALGFIYGSTAVTSALVSEEAATGGTGIAMLTGTVGSAVVLSGVAISSIIPFINPEDGVQLAYDAGREAAIFYKKKTDPTPNGKDMDKYQKHDNGEPEKPSDTPYHKPQETSTNPKPYHKPENPKPNSNPYHKPEDPKPKPYHKPSYTEREGTSKGFEVMPKPPGNLQNGELVSTGHVGDIRNDRNWTDLIPDDMKNKNISGGGTEEPVGPSNNPTPPVTTPPTQPITQPPTVPPTTAPTVPPTERPTEVITQPETVPPTVAPTEASTPSGTPVNRPVNQPNGGGNNYNYTNNTSDNNVPKTEVPTTVKVEEDIIKKGRTYKLPTSTKTTTTTTTTTTSSGNGVIPVLAGIGAAAAAGIGAKAYIDRKNNRDNDEESADIKTEDWSNNTDVNIEYQEPIEQKEETLDFDDDGYAQEEPEKYGARTHQELEDLQ